MSRTLKLEPNRPPKQQPKRKTQVHSAVQLALMQRRNLPDLPLPDPPPYKPMG